MQTRAKIIVKGEVQRVGYRDAYDMKTLYASTSKSYLI